MAIKRLLLFVLLLFFGAKLSAQGLLYGTYFRPPGLDWQQIKTEHFRIIYPAGEDSAASQTASILENQYLTASKLTGGKLKNFPVVLMNYNDWSNGAVFSSNFRSEFDLAPYKGKAMNPASGNWLETVLPHELLHATHAEVNTPFSLGGLIRKISPDLARTINFYPPVGLHEGLAVYYESNYVHDGGGRLNYPNFYNQLNSNIASGRPWSMSRIFQPSNTTLPYDRNYIAGGSFMQWLARNYGEESIRNSIRFHYNFFFLGYGTALRHSTGKWPGKLHKEFIASLKAEEQQRLVILPSTTHSKHRVLEVPYKGMRLQRPLWISDHEIIYYGTQYNAIRGFYIYDLNTDKTKLFKETTVTGDFQFSLNHDSDELFFSKFKRRALFPGAYLADVYQLDLETGKTHQKTKKSRAYSPVPFSDSILALQTNHDHAAIISIDKEGVIEVLSAFEEANPVAMAVNPNENGLLAVLSKRDGMQGIWLVNASDLDGIKNVNPAIAFKNASINDISWHPDGKRLLFTADEPPALNIYEYNLETQKTIQITTSLYNAFEASYSPDGNAIAYSFLDGEETKLAVLYRGDFDNTDISEKILLGSSQVYSKRKDILHLEDLKNNWKPKSYGKDFSWLKPRTLYPVWHRKNETNQIGVGFYTTDVLGSQNYAAEFTGIQNRLWYDISYSNKTFLPGFKIRAYNDPSFFLFDSDADGDGINDFNGGTINEKSGLMSEERGFRLSIPLNINFKDLSRSSALFLEPKLTMEQIRYSSLEPQPLSDFANQYKAGYFTQLNWKILALPRDVQQASGIVLFSSYERALNSPQMDLTFPQTGNSYNLTLSNRWGHYYGIFGFLSPLRRFNQSLRLDLRFLQQSRRLLYSTDTITPLGFKTNVFPNSNNLARFSSRYAIPLHYTDNGFLLVPFHLSTVYLSLFSHTISDLNGSDPFANTRTIIGGGFHFLFKISNLNFDIGVGLAYEPASRQTQFILGNF